MPFESDLDGRVGYAARIRYSIPERFNIQFTRVDNRGDRLLHRGEHGFGRRCRGGGVAGAGGGARVDDA